MTIVEMMWLSFAAGGVVTVAWRLAVLAIARAITSIEMKQSVRN